jgi:predicted small integral membrane protein
MTWMAWTLPTALFFIGIALVLGVYTAWGSIHPSLPRRGFLPMATTRGDRLFVGLLASAYVNLAWAGLSTAPQWIAMGIWLPLMLIVGRWG